MATFAQKLIETIDKDIKALEQAENENNKEVRKECNIIGKRIDDLENLTTSDSEKLQGFRNRIEQLLKCTSQKKRLQQL